MGHRVTITGSSATVMMDERAITKVEVDSNTPNDSNARATDYGMSVKIHGKMLYSVGAGDNDQTLALAAWSQVPSYKSDCYRAVQVEVISASQVVRKFTLPDAFVVEYSETLDDESGVGTFYIHVKQKKDQNAQVAIDGGFGA